MPGSSLWLLPPPSHPLHRTLTTLITQTLPSHFPREAASSPRVTPHYFPPHVTLTSGIDVITYSGGGVAEEGDGGGGGDDERKAQRWLDSVFTGEVLASLRAGVKVRFERVESQDVFYRRCFVRVGFEGVRALAGVARAAGVNGEGVSVGEDGGLVFEEETEKWLDSWREEYGPHLSLMYGGEFIWDGTLDEATKVVQQAGIKLSDGETEGLNQDSAWDGWDGGVIWLVPTYKPISEWGKPIATKQL